MLPPVILMRLDSPQPESRLGGSVPCRAPGASPRSEPSCLPGSTGSPPVGLALAGFGLLLGFRLDFLILGLAWLWFGFGWIWLLAFIY